MIASCDADCVFEWGYKMTPVLLLLHFPVLIFTVTGASVVNLVAKASLLESLRSKHLLEAVAFRALA